VVRRLAAALSLAALAVTLVAGAADAQTDIRVRGVETSRFPEVSLVLEARKGATPAGMRVTENGVPVSGLSVSGIGEVGGTVETVLAIDASNSMKGEALSTALEAARVFVERTPPDSPIGILTFAAEPRILVPVTDNRAAVDDAVSSIATSTSQGTGLFDAIVAASDMFRREGQRNIILLTDGRDRSGTLGLEEAVAAAGEAGATVFTIALEGPDIDAATLDAISRRTGGTFAAITPTKLETAYEDLALQLATQFVVTYRSRSPHGVAVTVDIETASGTASATFVTPSPIAVGGADRSFLLRMFTGTTGVVLTVGLTFLAVLTLMSTVVEARYRRRRAQVLRSRAGLPAPPSARPSREDHGSSLIPQQLADIVEKGTDGTGIASAIARKLQRAGVAIRVGELLAGVVIGIGIAAFVGTVIAGPLLGAIFAVFAAIVPWVVVSKLAAKRIGKIEAQLPDLLMILASSLRAGHSFLQALDTATKEIGDPAAGELGRTLAEIRLGRNVGDALDALAVRIGSQDLGWAVTAIEIQRKVGGNLAEVLETVARTIRERETLRRQVKVLSAEGRLSVTILTVLPFLLALYLMAVNPEYLAVLTGTPIGVLLIIGALTLMGVGYVWMRKIVKLDA
jgi:tight adherence protein B